MDKVDDGGPAYPELETPELRSAPGMTLRQYYAAKAMHGILSYPPVGSADDLALLAFQMADAMIAAEKKNDAR